MRQRNCANAEAGSVVATTGAVALGAAGAARAPWAALAVCAGVGIGTRNAAAANAASGRAIGNARIFTDSAVARDGGRLPAIDSPSTRRASAPFASRRQRTTTVPDMLGPWTAQSYAYVPAVLNMNW